MVSGIKEGPLVRLSVVVPAFNSQNTIEDCLVSIRQSAYKDYELIVVDDGSNDQTVAIARKYANKLLALPHAGRISARENGLKAANGQILVNIDSDVLIKTDTLARISDFFETHPQADALTGCLSKDSPDQGFFSQYKHLYMHYIFSKLPERVTFLFGSIYARRTAEQHDFRLAAKDTDLIAKIADDTALGQRYTASGKHIGFLKDLQVTHLKRFTLFSFVKNDFDIPFEWANIFLSYQGWKQIGGRGTGYCHSPKEQLLSVVLAPLLLAIFIITALCGTTFAYATFGFAFMWFLLNIRFLTFLALEKGAVFGSKATLVTFFDNIVMAIGIACGVIAYIVKKAGNQKCRVDVSGIS